MTRHLTPEEEQHMLQQYKKQESEQKTGCRLGCTGCFTIILMLAILCIVVNECKRSNIRLDHEKYKYQKEIKKPDSIVHQAACTYTAFGK